MLIFTSNNWWRLEPIKALTPRKRPKTCGSMFNDHESMSKSFFGQFFNMILGLFLSFAFFYTCNILCGNSKKTKGITKFDLILANFVC